MDRKFIKLFHDVSRSVPAYRDFLKRHHLNPRRIKSSEDFEKIPVMTKENYLSRYALRYLWLEKTLPPVVYASSGSSGRSRFWFRGDIQEEGGGVLHERIFRDVFRIKKSEPTLVIICFSMGIWVAGGFTQAACRAVARRGYKLCVASPGLEKEDIMNVLSMLAPSFRKVILVGYPPYLMDVVREARKHGISLGRGVKILTAGDKITETWRDVMLKFLGSKDPYHSLVSVYGSSDAAALGHETPLTIFLRRQALLDKGLYQELFGDSVSLPTLVQFDPAQIYFERIDEELAFTTGTSIPLIRYNIHDCGEVFTYVRIVEILKQHGLWHKAKRYIKESPKFPLVAVKGRTDVAVTFYAVNIFPENIQSGLNKPAVRKYLSGNFQTYNHTTSSQAVQKLYIELELAKGRCPNLESKKRMEASLVKTLEQVNIEYRKLRAAIGDRVLPVFRFLPFRGGRFPVRKGFISIRGKKPRMVL